MRQRTWSHALAPRSPAQVSIFRCAAPPRPAGDARTNVMTFEVIGASMLAGWSSAVALIAALSGLWVVMLFALAAYYLVLRVEGIWFEAGRTRLAGAAFRFRAGIADALAGSGPRLWAALRALWTAVRGRRR